MHILYLTHDLSDATTSKRVAMLMAGGATVTLAGFSRHMPPLTIAGSPVHDLGRTHNGRFLQRIVAVLRIVTGIEKHRALFASADVILARNLEMLAIAVRGANGKPIIYESLDIHRLLLREDVIGKSLRTLEGCLSRRASLVITSSPAFIREYFEKRSRVKLPLLLLENKTFGTAAPAPTPRKSGPPWRIGWFGALRCQQSLDILCDVARANPGLVEVIIRGRVAHDQLPNFDAQVAASHGVSFLGPYENPNDLAAIYHDVHVSWAIDMFEEGLNSSWLLPNRIYEGGLHGTVPLAAEGVETATFIQQLGIGHVLAEPKRESLTQFLKSLNPEQFEQLANTVTALPTSTWLASDADCAALVARLQSLIVTAPAPITALPIPADMPTLVVIPCLNEAKNIAPLVEYLQTEARQLPMTIVIADGGSTDGTVTIAERLAATYTNVHYLHNPKRIQSAAINLAVTTYGAGHGYLIRIDAHAYYPQGFCAALIADANRTGADSVVVSMRTVGNPGFQEALAAAQNSKLGNGGSSHRSNLREGKWVDHGHHALMRIASFRTVQGYDETFTHNEDAELDVRLRRAGYRIWLTATTTLDYFPRSSPIALFKQYRNYGLGRVRNLLKHREKPKLRQMIPVAVAPAIALLAAAPFISIAALPFFLWAGLCIGYGFHLAHKANNPTLALAGPAAMLMHAGWSLGFWQGLIRYGKSRA